MIRLSKKEKVLMDMLRNFEIDLNYVAYVFTITGGGWGSYHYILLQMTGKFYIPICSPNPFFYLI